jgi:hypothetical protein
VCYDFFFVTGFMYTDKKAPSEIRGQAQGLLVFVTQGVGMYFGYMLAFNRFGATVTNYDKLTEAINAARPQETLSFAESLMRMVSVSLPAGVDPTLLTETMQQWKQFWLLPAGMAAVILIVFAALFHERDDGRVKVKKEPALWEREEAPR